MSPFIPIAVIAGLGIWAWRKSSGGAPSSTGNRVASSLGMSAPDPYGTVGYVHETTDLSPMEVQQALNAMGYGPLVEDGIFGPLTTAAVKKFQSATGLTADGVVGPITEAAIRTAMANQGLVLK